MRRRKRKGNCQLPTRLFLGQHAHKIYSACGICYLLIKTMQLSLLPWVFQQYAVASEAPMKSTMIQGGLHGTLSIRQRDYAYFSEPMVSTLNSDKVAAAGFAEFLPAAELCVISISMAQMYRTRVAAVCHSSCRLSTRWWQGKEVLIFFHPATM